MSGTQRQIQTNDNNLNSSTGYPQSKKAKETPKMMDISASSTTNKKVDFNKTSTEGFSIQSAIKRSILKQHNLNTT